MITDQSAQRNSAGNHLEISRTFNPAAFISSLRLSFVLITVMAWAGCGGGAGSSTDPFVSPSLGTIAVSPTTAKIAVGGVEQLQPAAKDENGNPMAGISFTFSSSSSVATVSSTGLVKGVSAGSATITVGAGGKTASVSITVTAPPPPQPVLTQISVSPASASIAAGQAQTYTAVGYDQFNNPMSGVSFAWASDDNGSIVSLNANVATGVSPGIAHITASASGISSGPASLTVLQPPSVLTSIVVTPAAPSIFTGGTQQFTAVGYDQRGNPMNGFTFSWLSTNKNVATVSVAGVATGVAVGTSQITASAQGVNSNAVMLTVNQPPSVLTTIQASPSTASIQTGTTQQFAAVGYDQYGNVMGGIVFDWSSSVASVASVSAVNSEGQNQGIATGLAAGSTQITVSASGVTATVSLTVTAPPPPPPGPAVAAINLLPGNISINIGGTQQFSAMATDQNGLTMGGVAFSWTSSDPTVAAVDANGFVHGVGVGTVQIIASAQGTSSNSAALTVSLPDTSIPLTVTRISPPMALVGSGDLIPLTIFGTGFLPGALVNFGSNILIPSSVNATAITVTVPAAELTALTPPNQPLQVTVTNPAPNAGTSSALPFTISQHGLVSIDFDDGYQSMYDNGLPILDAAGLKSTQYIITQNVGLDSYVTLDEVIQMYNNGHEIGDHTRTHPTLTTLTQGQMTDEILGAKQDLISWGIMPTTLAYPYGAYSPAVEAVVQGAGLRGARDSDLGYNSSGLGLTFGGPLYHDTLPLVLWSEAAETDMNTTLSDITSEIDYAVANNLWLIILFHRVDETDPCCVSISVDHTLIQGTVDYLVQQHVPVVTNNEGMIIENLNAQN
ncbi:MAG: Ig-like domain-containing protein [Terriglobales bacterium]